MSELTGYGEHTPITLGGDTKGQAMNREVITKSPDPENPIIFKGNDDLLYSDYDGHEWRSASPWHKNHQGITWDFKCEVCGQEHHGHPKDFPKGGCKTRFAPIEWHPAEKRDHLAAKYQYLNKDRKP